MPARLVFLASGSGTLLQSVLDSPLRGYVVGVGSDRADAEALQRARRVAIDTFVLDPGDFADRAHWDAALADAIGDFDPDVVVSAGFMRILGASSVNRFKGRLINTHPALLPAFPGAHAVRDALAAGVPTTGCTVHYIDQGIDTGPVIAQTAVEVLADDDEVTLHERIKVAERRLLNDVLTNLIEGH